MGYTLAHTDLKGQSPLISFRGGRPTNRKHVERVMHRWGRAANVANCSPHRARHSYASALLRAGVDIRVIKDMLGHEDISSTMIYTAVTDSMQVSAAAKLPWKLI